jgi:hypothetical protein
MKSRRFAYYRENASKLHNSVGAILRCSPFTQHKVYQEYPVNRIDPDFPSGRHKFDWVILDLAVVIECHGEQHYRTVKWSKDITDEEAYKALLDTQRRDEVKKQAAEGVGFTYVVVKYDEVDRLDADLLLQRIRDNRTSTALVKKRDIWKERAREYRRQRYEYLKEVRDAAKLHGRDGAD